jgi:hypothetical protein
MTERGIQVHFSLIGNDMVIRCRQEEVIEEFIPPSVLKGDLPRSLIDKHHHWYMEDKDSVEVRQESQTWSRNGPRNWKIILSKATSPLTGTAERRLMSGPSRLVDPHSRIYTHLSKTLKPLEPRHDGILVSVDNDDLVVNPTVLVQRHDLTFYVNPSNSLECQSFPGFVVEVDYSGVGSMIGLQSVVSLRKMDPIHPFKKIIIPKGVISSQIGLYGHPLTVINVSNSGGYFAYDVDELLGRFCGSRSVESDLFLIQLHAFTASPVADPLTGRSGTSVALEYLGNSSCFSAHKLSKEARGYLDTLASLTPQRTFYPPYLQVMETVQWNPSLPTLSQHPSFLSLVGSILDHWRTMEIFHSLEDLLDPIDLPTGMEHLNARASARNWMYHVSSPISTFVEDLIHQHRDAVNELQSQERERLAFQIARLANPTVSSFPLCTSLHSTVFGWQYVEETHDWSWDNIEDWFSCATSMKRIWCTLYQLCKGANHHSSFNLIATLSLLGYRGAPLDILATLIAVFRRLAATELNFPVSTPLDLTKGTQFNREELRGVLEGYSVGFERSEEFNIAQRPGETGEARYRRGEAHYQTELSSQINQAISELEPQWPDLPNHLHMTTRRLLDLNNESRERLHGILLEWSRNRAFSSHINQVSQALRPFHSPPTIFSLYAPNVKTARRRSLPPPISRVDTLMKMIQPRPPIQNNQLQPLHKPSQSKIGATTIELDDLFAQLDASAHRELELLYLENLRKSIRALTEAQPSFDPNATTPSSEQLRLFQQHARNLTNSEFSDLKDTLTPRDYVSSLKTAVGLHPMVTPTTLLRQLSLRNRKHLPESWKNRLLQYALTVQDAKWGDRMLRLQSTGKVHHLLLEAQNRREWDPYEHPDWLLVEIDADLSIRPQQADMAEEMISPPDGRNSVMQLNMGEGKSSVRDYKRYCDSILMGPIRSSFRLFPCLPSILGMLSLG